MQVAYFYRTTNLKYAFIYFCSIRNRKTRNLMNLLQFTSVEDLIQAQLLKGPFSFIYKLTK